MNTSLCVLLIFKYLNSSITFFPYKLHILWRFAKNTTKKVLNYDKI